MVQSLDHISSHKWVGAQTLNNRIAAKNRGAISKHKAMLVSPSGPWASPVFVCAAPVFINGSLDARQTSGFYYMVGSAAFEAETQLTHKYTAIGK